jgi:hypothetical protein
MATISQVKAGLDEIAKLIRNATSVRESAKANLLNSRNQLENLPTQFSDVIAEIDGYSPTGAFETLAKDEKAKLQTEFVALKSALETELTAIGVEFS